MLQVHTLYRVSNLSREKKAIANIWLASYCAGMNCFSTGDDRAGKVVVGLPVRYVVCLVEDAAVLLMYGEYPDVFFVFFPG